MVVFLTVCSSAMVVFYVTNMISHVWSAAIGNLFDTIFRKVMITKESYETI